MSPINLNLNTPRFDPFSLSSVWDASQQYAHDWWNQARGFVNEKTSDDRYNTLSMEDALSEGGGNKISSLADVILSDTRADNVFSQRYRNYLKKKMQMAPLFDTLARTTGMLGNEDATNIGPSNANFDSRWMMNIIDPWQSTIGNLDPEKTNDIFGKITGELNKVNDAQIAGQTAAQAGIDPKRWIFLNSLLKNEDLLQGVHSLLGRGAYGYGATGDLMTGGLNDIYGKRDRSSMSWLKWLQGIYGDNNQNYF